MNGKPVARSLAVSEEDLTVLTAARGVGRTPTGGWLRAKRLAQALPQQQLAAKLGIKRQAWAQLETSEAREAISLSSLRRAANVLGYDLVYTLVPRGESAGEIPPETTHLSSASPPSAPAWTDAELPTELR